MAEPPLDIVVVGAGPAGLCAAAAARRRGWEPVLLERGDRVGGLWARIPGDLRCLSPRHRDRLPDGSHPVGPGARAAAAEVLAALTRFADRERFEVRFGVEAAGLERRGEAWELQTTAGPLLARRVVVATGEFGRPHVPERPGTFQGRQEHSSTCDPSTLEPGQRVVLVGSGASAVDLVPRLLARSVDLTICARTPILRPRGLPGRLVGAALWRASGLPVRILPPPLRCRGATPALDPDLFDAVEERRARLRGGVDALHATGVVAGGEVLDADVVIWATGFRRDVGWIDGLTLDADGVPAHDEGLSTDLEGVAFLALPCMRTRRSGFLRGLAADAEAAIGRL
jgi:putative flavoprotein involved in K+ transport